jgi:hypothetical protein
MAVTKTFQEGIIDGIKSLTTPKLRSNQAINSIAKGAINNGTGAFEVAHRVMGPQKQGFKQAVKETFTHKDGTLNYGKIAGSYIGASTAMRVVSGGGVTKDRNGNSNLIGVPFI